VDNRRHPFTGWATLPHRGTRHRTGWVSRARVGRVRCARVGWVSRARVGWVSRARVGRVRCARVGLVRRAIDDAVQGAGWTGVVGHAGSLA
jgi:hypothetical protein